MYLLGGRRMWWGGRGYWILNGVQCCTSVRLDHNNALPWPFPAKHALAELNPRAPTPLLFRAAFTLLVQQVHLPAGERVRLAVGPQGHGDRFRGGRLRRRGGGVRRRGDGRRKPHGRTDRLQHGLLWRG